MMAEQNVEKNISNKFIYTSPIFQSLANLIHKTKNHTPQMMFHFSVLIYMYQAQWEIHQSCTKILANIYSDV